MTSTTRTGEDFLTISIEWSSTGQLHRFVALTGDGRVLGAYVRGWDEANRQVSVSLYEPTGWLYEGGYEHSTVTSYHAERDSFDSDGFMGLVSTRRGWYRTEAVRVMQQEMEKILPGLLAAGEADDFDGRVTLPATSFLDLVADKLV